MKNRKFSKSFFASLCLCALVSVQISFAQVNESSDAESNSAASPLAIIYDNGGLATGATSNSGVAAPAGTQWSEAQNPFGNTMEANTTAGVSCSVTATVFRCADDFNVPVGQTWTINQVIVFAYQTGFTGATSPITAATLRIWLGRPGDAGSTIVFGDTTTNRLATSTDSGLFRIFSSVVGTGANPPTIPANNRRIWQNNITVAPAAVLTAGNYWIDWNTQIGATTAHFAPSNTIRGTRGAPFWNARQNTGAAWTNSVDVGQFPTGAPTPPSLPQDFPFKLDGTIAGAPAVPASRSGDYDGDNKTDLAIARSANAMSPSQWWISTSGTPLLAQSVTTFGVGIGFGTRDIPAPADYDGDGKTDLAYWCPMPSAGFYILESTTNVVRFELFGQAGDDPTIVADYDGDGKADPAVFRASAGTFFYRGSLSNPGGAITYILWGTSGDKAILGDFDGDKKADFRVVRNNAGSAQHWLRLSTGAVSVSSFGLFSDKLGCGDFDADAKTDIAVIRNNGASLEWFIQLSATGVTWSEKYGNSATDYVVPGDYDGDNKTDLVLWRSGTAADQGFFFLRNTSTSPYQSKWGNSTGAFTAPDYPVANWLVK